MNVDGGAGLPDPSLPTSGSKVIPILLGLAGLAVVAAAVWYFVFREDPALAHERFRREVFGATHQRYYDQFWHCALTVPPGDITNNAALAQRIEKNAAGEDATRYGRYLLESEKCLPLLSQAIPEYRALKNNPATPPDYHALLDDMSRQIEEVNRAWTEYAQYGSQTDFRKELRDGIKQRGEHFAGYEGAIEQRDSERQTKYRKNAVNYYNFIQCVLGLTSYTSFTGGRGSREGAHYKLVAALDDRCREEGDDFLRRVQLECRDALFPEKAVEPTKEFEDAVRHWIKQGETTAPRCQS